MTIVYASVGAIKPEIVIMRLLITFNKGVRKLTEVSLTASYNMLNSIVLRSSINMFL